MHRVYSGEAAAKIDEISIKEKKIPSVILMERAALAVSRVVFERLKGLQKEKGVLCVCGNGNNGADALAVARHMNEKKIPVKVFLAGDIKGKKTEEFLLQQKILKELKIPMLTKIPQVSSFAVIVDGLFGNGLKRKIEGSYYELIKKINASSATVISIDVPSGINSTSGCEMGISIKADDTVTFGSEKTGLLLYPGAKQAGKLHVADIGFAPDAFKELNEKIYALDRKELEALPKREDDSNKGSFGKVFIAAGSKDMGGAAILCAKAALKCGAGLVRVLTHENNRSAILSHSPEIIPLCYKDKNELEKRSEEIKKHIGEADCVLAGPGLSTDEIAHKITELVLQNTKSSLVLDADALNIISFSKINKNTFRLHAKNIFITPHIKEMSRLNDMSTDDIKADILNVAADFAGKHKINLVLKDSKTVISDGSKIYINTKGNNGMATAGTGDVLAGILSGLAASGITSKSCAATGVYIHSLAGDIAACRYSRRALTASDIVNTLPDVLKCAEVHKKNGVENV